MMTMDRNSEDGAQLSPEPQMIEVYPSGEYVDLIDPKPETIHARDIIHHLSLTTRYAGGVRRFYSVAEHVCLVADLVKYVVDDGERKPASLHELQRGALMHDAAEAYIGDVTAPCKWAMRVLETMRSNIDLTFAEVIEHIQYQQKSVKSTYDDIGDKLDAVIGDKFSCYCEYPEIRVADLWAMKIEAEQLTVSQGKNWRWPHELPYGGSLPGDVQWYGGVSPETAEILLTNKYQELFALAL